MNLHVFPSDPQDLRGQSYALGLVSSGYESRGRYLWNDLSPNANAKVSFVFPNHCVLDYKANVDFFREKGFAEEEPSHAAVKKRIVRELTAAAEAQPAGMLRTLVDISCMTRLLIAAICYEMGQVASALKRRICVDFVYACAEFGAVPNVDGPITANGPAIPQLAGWPLNPSAPLGLIVGIGYEEDLALGVIEELEAAEVWAFRPKDHDPQYELEIENKNRGLFDEIPVANMIRYPLYDAYSLFSSVEACVGVAKAESRVVIVPLGPKIFALVSCLASLRHHPAVGFWRVSSGENLTPVDRVASGKIVSIRAEFF